MAFAPEFNYVALIVAAIAAFLVGWIWYGPAFGKKWMALSGAPQEKPSMAQIAVPSVIGLVGVVVTTFVFAHVMAAFGAAELASAGGTHTAAQINGSLDTVTLGMALEGAGWTWLGFFLPVQVGLAIWEKKPWALVAINSGHYLVVLAVMATIIVSWP